MLADAFILWLLGQGISSKNLVPSFVQCDFKISNGVSSFRLGHDLFTCFRGSAQPFCRSLPEDPLLTCFEPDGNKGIRRKQQLPAFYHVYKPNLPIHFEEVSVVGDTFLSILWVW
jgi:hypothetical protein